MIKKLYIFRHGETDFNVANRAHGIIDIPLNKNGIAQAHALAEQLSKVHLDVIYTSKLSRAKQTAQIVAEKQNADIIVDDGLHEWNLGVFCGKVLHFIHARKNKPIDLTSNDVYIPYLVMADGDYVPQNGESFNAFKKRICDSLENIVKNTDAQNIGIATHGGAIRAILTQYTNLSNGGMPNAGYFVLQWDGKTFNLVNKPDWLVKKHPLLLALEFIKKMMRTK